jgi:asparagine synthase (glutamine-hydrolysing)
MFARQPMLSDDRTQTAVCDVRLDNREDVLTSLGLPTDTRNVSDEELTFRAWQRWGKDALQRLIGPLAMVVWDSTKQRTTLIRDPSGVHPLNYHLSERRLSVASMPRALHALGDIERKVNLDVFIDTLCQMNDKTDGGYFENIHLVEPGTLIEVTKDQVKTTQWYVPQDAFQNISYARDTDYVEAGQALLDTILRAQTRTQGRLGSFMSGGLDSSLMAVRASDILKSDGVRLPVYCSVPEADWGGVTPKGYYGDETPHVQAIADQYDALDLHLVDSQGCGMFDSMDEYLHFAEHPIRNALNVHWMHSILARAKTHGVTTMLEGTTGNATLTYHEPNIAAAILRENGVGGIAEALRHSGGTFPKRARTLASAILRPWIPTPYYAWKMWRRFGRGPSWSAHIAAKESAAQSREVLRRSKEHGHGYWVRPLANPRSFMLKILTDYAQPHAHGLAVATRMMYGIDLRDPFADRRMIEWCFSIPIQQFNLNGEKRSLGKRIARGLLPLPVAQQEFGKGMQTPDAHLKLTRDKARIIDLLDQLALNEDINAVMDIDRMRKTINDLGDESTFFESTRAYQASVILPLALQAARLVQTESSGNV